MRKKEENRIEFSWLSLFFCITKKKKKKKITTHRLYTTENRFIFQLIWLQFEIKKI